LAIVAAAVAGAALLTGCDHPRPRHVPAPARAPRRAAPAAAPVPLRRLVGQMVIAGMDGTAPSEDLLNRIRAGELGGVILFTDNVGTDLRATITALQRAARAGGNPPLLIGIDQEGGGVKRLGDAPPYVSPRTITTVTDAFMQGHLTGRTLAGDGINLDFAPVADVATGPESFVAVEDRGFSGTPAQVADRAGAFMRGLQRAGVAATAKHFPGVGALPVDTDYRLSSITRDAAETREALLPFRHLIDGGVDVVMVASAVYPDLDAARPADFSPAITTGLLRTRLRFRGVAITDALDTPDGLGGGSGERALRAARAGADIVLFAGASEGRPAYEAMLAAARAGELARPRLEQSYERVVALKHGLAAAG